MASRVLRSIYRQAASSNCAAGRQSVNWLCRKPTSGSPIRSVSGRRLMSTVSNRITPEAAAAAAPWLMLPPSYGYGGNMINKLFKVSGKMDYNFYSPADDKVVSLSKRSSFGEGRRLGNWLCRKATSASPIRSVFNRRLMNTVSDRISPPAAAPWLMLPPSYDYGGNMTNKLFKFSGKMDYKFYSPADDKVVSLSRRSSFGEGRRLGNWLCRKATSGLPIRTVPDRRLMSTVSDRKAPAAAAPWLMLPPSYDYGGSMINKLFGVGGKMDYKFYSLADDKVVSLSKRSSIGEDKLKLRAERKAVVVGSSHGWLALYKSWFNWDLFLYNPISHRHIKLPPVERTIMRHSERPFKIILSCSPEEDSNSCRAILCYGRGSMAVCCPGQSTEWTKFGAHFHENDAITKKFKKARVVREYEDFVYSTTQKQLFCVTQYTDFESWDLEDPLSPKLNWKMQEADLNYDKKTYPIFYYYDEEISMRPHIVFAEHSNKLFLVRRHIMRHVGPDGSIVKPNPIYRGLDRIILDETLPDMTTYFDVHVVDREKGELVYMDDTLDGMSFFVGSSEHGFVVESPEKMNLKPNSIYFTDIHEYNPPLWIEYRKYGGHDIGIFDYGNKIVYPCYYPCLASEFKRIRPHPMWFTPSSSPSPAPV